VTEFLEDRSTTAAALPCSPIRHSCPQREESRLDYLGAYPGSRREKSRRSNRAASLRALLAPVRSVRSLGEVTEPRSLALREAEGSAAHGRRRAGLRRGSERTASDGRGGGSRCGSEGPGKTVEVAPGRAASRCAHRAQVPSERKRRFFHSLSNFGRFPPLHRQGEIRVRYVPKSFPPSCPPQPWRRRKPLAEADPVAACPAPRSPIPCPSPTSRRLVLRSLWRRRITLRYPGLPPDLRLPTDRLGRHLSHLMQMLLLTRQRRADTSEAPGKDLA